MARHLPITAKMVHVRPITMDCTSIGIRAEILTGPDNLIGRRLELVINPQTLVVEIKKLQDLLETRERTLDSRKEESVISEV